MKIYEKIQKCLFKNDFYQFLVKLFGKKTKFKQ